MQYILNTKMDKFMKKKKIELLIVNLNYGQVTTCIQYCSIEHRTIECKYQ